MDRPDRRDRAIAPAMLQFREKRQRRIDLLCLAQPQPNEAMRLAQQKSCHFQSFGDFTLSAIGGQMAAMPLRIELKAMEWANESVAGNFSLGQRRPQMGAAVMLGNRVSSGSPPTYQPLTQALEGHGFIADFTAFQNGIPLVFNQSHRWANP